MDLQEYSKNTLCLPARPLKRRSGVEDFLIDDQLDEITPMRSDEVGDVASQFVLEGAAMVFEH